MRNSSMGTETVPMRGIHLVQKLYSFLYLPWVPPMCRSISVCFRGFKCARVDFFSPKKELQALNNGGCYE